MRLATLNPSDTWTTLNTLTGGLSAPSKMPCHGWSIPAQECAVGSLLRKIKGSTCSGCYALKGRYVFPNVAAALTRRLEAWRSDRAQWVEAMTASILKTRSPYFRWLDSGDLQGLEMLEDIAEVARRTPSVTHWLPTRERDVVATYKKRAGELPSNLTVRLSAAMVDAPLKPAARGALKGVPVSMVHTKAPHNSAHVCPAPSQGGKCADCRACWNSSIKGVSYAAH